MSAVELLNLLDELKANFVEYYNNYKKLDSILKYKKWYRNHK